MGPVSSKIEKLIKNSDLSEETKNFLESLKNDINKIEMMSINHAYDNGHHDSQRGVRVNNYFQRKYPNYIFSQKKK